MDVSAHEVGVSYSYANDRILNQGLHTFSLFVQVGDTKRFTYSQEKGNGHVVVRTTVLNVRHGPGVEHSRIGKVLQGQRFELLERKGDWTRIRLADGRSGWVHIDYVIIIDG
jgi:N-acetylmuramoyl-L-alanine amidase